MRKYKPYPATEPGDRRALSSARDLVSSPNVSMNMPSVSSLSVVIKYLKESTTFSLLGLTTSVISLNESHHKKTCFLLYANNKGAVQPAHPRSLISAFVIHCLGSIITVVSICKISSLYLASVAAQAGLSDSLPWSQTLKTGFLVTRLQFHQWQSSTIMILSIPTDRSYLFTLGKQCRSWSQTDKEGIWW